MLLHSPVLPFTCSYSPVLLFTCSFNATCVCCKWCCCTPLHLQLMPHVYVVSGVAALPFTCSFNATCVCCKWCCCTPLYSPSLAVTPLYSPSLAVNATCVCCKWCCCTPIHLQLTPHVYVVNGITALPSTRSRVVVLVGYYASVLYVLPKLCSCIGWFCFMYWFVILCFIYVLVFMY